MPPVVFGSNAPKCARCNKSVYDAEAVKGAGKTFHNTCFTCATCKKTVTPVNLADKDGEIYCQACYAKNFGPKGFGIGNASVQTGKAVWEGQIVDATGAATGASASSSSSSSSSSSASHSHSSNATPSSLPKPVAVAGGLGGLGGGEKCNSCHKTVYHAEKVTGAGHTYHDSCFKCGICSTRLSSTNCNDKDEKLYCNPCYAKTFGPKGYGFGGGAGTLQYTQ